MIEPFQFSRTPKIIFGSGVISKLPGLIDLYGTKVIIVTGKGSFTRSKHFSNLTGIFESKRTAYRIICIPGEPTPEIIDNSVADLKGFDADIVAAVGGGSVMDAGKAISAMLNRPESITDFLEDIGTKKHPGTKIPFIAVPTTSGTGSEATKNAVISRTGITGFKKSLRHDNFVPDIALVDPELTVSCPPDITAASGMDCFSQLVEAYLSTKSSIYTDALAIEGLKALKDSLVAAFTDGQNLKARTGMSMAALTSGICLANAGLGVVHGFASSVGAVFDIPHGLLCGTLMAVCNEINVKKLLSTRNNPQALRKYAILGELFLEDKGKTDQFYIDGFIAYLHELTEKLNLPVLNEAGFDKILIPEICRNTGMKNNPVSLDNDELSWILQRRLI